MTDHSKTIILPATSADQTALHALAMRSKAHWGYDAAFMEACADELRVPTGYFGKFPVYMACEGDKAVGYYVLVQCENNEWELEHLFIDTDAIGKGTGRKLLAHAMMRAKESGAKRITVQSDPFAEPFYVAMGFVKFAESPSASIPDRYLPLMETSL